MKTYSNTVYTCRNALYTYRDASRCNSNSHMVTDGSNYLNSFTAFDPCGDQCTSVDLGMDQLINCQSGPSPRSSAAPQWPDALL